MSIVGPRPERPEMIAHARGRRSRSGAGALLMKPGMTGWAQVRCGYASDCETAAEKLAHDFWYMRYGNLAVDVAVCLRTALLALEVLDPRPLWSRLRLRAAREPAR